MSTGTELELRDQGKRSRRETWLVKLSDLSEGVGRSVLRFVGSVWGQLSGSTDVALESNWKLSL